MSVCFFKRFVIFVDFAALYMLSGAHAEPRGIYKTPHGISFLDLTKMSVAEIIANHLVKVLL